MMQEVPLIEPYPVEDEFCFELVRVEDLGDAVRFVLASPQTRFEENRPVRVITKKIVLPYSNVRPGVEMTVAFLARKAVAAGGAKLLSLVQG